MNTTCESDLLVQENDDPSQSVTARLDAENRRVAKQLHEAAYVYALYGALDGLSLSYSMVKYCFDLLYTDSSLSSSDLMHDWMLTPAGMAAAAIESITIIAFSILANIFDDKDKNAFKRYVAVVWPYCRDTMKGLKNAYKGVRSTLQAAGMLVGQDLRYLMVPVGLVFGALSILNRIWYRQMKDQRKSMQKDNADLLLEIQANCRFHWMECVPGNTSSYKNSYILVGQQLYYVKPDGTIDIVVLSHVERFLDDLKKLNTGNKKTLYLTEELTQNLITANSGHIATRVFDAETCAEFRQRIGKQSAGVRTQAFFSQAYSGVVDGLYLYMGAMGLAALAPPVFMVMTVFSVIFTLTCIATRMYEEYEYQRKLVSTQAEVELAICGKELEVLFATLQGISEQLSDPIDESVREALTAEQQAIMKALENKMEQFETAQKFLHSQVTLSYKAAALAGLKNGLAAYGAIASVMFAVATVTAILMVAFPPALLIACMVAGMACLFGFLAHSLISNYWHLQKQRPQEPEPNTQLSELLKSIKDKRKEVRELKPTEIKEAILDGMVVDPSPQFFFQEWFEVFRSLFSGIAKGQKSVDYTLNPLQEVDDRGHYHDSSIMLWVSAISSMVYAVGLALRAYARGFSQDNPNDRRPKRINKIRSDDGKLHSLDRDNDAVELLPRPSGIEGTGGGLRPLPDSLQQKRPSLPEKTYPRQRFFSSNPLIRPASADHLASLPNTSLLPPTVELRV